MNIKYYQKTYYVDSTFKKIEVFDDEVSEFEFNRLEKSLHFLENILLEYTNSFSENFVISSLSADEKNKYLRIGLNKTIIFSNVNIKCIKYILYNIAKKHNIFIVLENDRIDYSNPANNVKDFIRLSVYNKSINYRPLYLKEISDIIF